MKHHTYKYTLDTSSRKFKCGHCGQKRLVLYINITTKEYLSDIVGRCDRENSCGYHYTPKQYFLDNNISFEKNSRFPFPRTKGGETGNGLKTDYLPYDIFYKSVSRYEQCDLYPFLETLFRSELAKRLCETYFIGSSRSGSTAFWQVDTSGRIRQCKIMAYCEDGHRNKMSPPFFAGKKILDNNEANLKQCFFGEYLLTLPENLNKPVAIVESEKTAVIASVYFNQFVWLATGGKHGAKWTESDVCKVLKGKKIVLYPDLGAFDIWKAKAQLLEKVAGCKTVVSDLMQINATKGEEKEGLDIADYLLNNKDQSGLALTDYGYPVIWDYKMDK